MKNSEWTVLGASIKGASHQKTKLPNQDAIQWSLPPPGGACLPIIMALSDGHGTDKCFRSHIGAQVAVEEAVRVAGEFMAHQVSHSSSPSTLKYAIEQALPIEIIRSWKQRIIRHREEFPFTADESIKAAELPDESRGYLPYGATLIVGILTGNQMFFLQLGDGDIVVVFENGEIVRPITRDPYMLGNDTYSLCMSNAQKLFRCRVHDIESPSPGLILMATDGYSNSFETEDDFLKVGTDLWRLCREMGAPYLGKHLADWLQAASTQGSGDDVTAGLICRVGPSAMTLNCEQQKEQP